MNKIFFMLNLMMPSNAGVLFLVFCFLAGCDRERPSVIKNPSDPNLKSWLYCEDVIKYTKSDDEKQSATNMRRENLTRCWSEWLITFNRSMENNSNDWRLATFANATPNVKYFYSPSSDEVKKWRFAKVDPDFKKIAVEIHGYEGKITVYSYLWESYGLSSALYAGRWNDGLIIRSATVYVKIEERSGRLIAVPHNKKVIYYLDQKAHSIKDDDLDDYLKCAGEIENIDLTFFNGESPRKNKADPTVFEVLSKNNAINSLLYLWQSLLVRDEVDIQRILPLMMTCSERVMSKVTRDEASPIFTQVKKSLIALDKTQEFAQIINCEMNAEWRWISDVKWVYGKSDTALRDYLKKYPGNPHLTEINDWLEQSRIYESAIGGSVSDIIDILHGRFQIKDSEEYANFKKMALKHLRLAKDFQASLEAYGLTQDSSDLLDAWLLSNSSSKSKIRVIYPNLVRTITENAFAQRNKTNLRKILEATDDGKDESELVFIRKKIEDLDYETSFTLTSLDDFMSNYPNSEHVTDAKKKRKQLAENAFVESVRLDMSYSNLINIVTFPGGPDNFLQDKMKFYRIEQFSEELAKKARWDELLALAKKINGPRKDLIEFTGALYPDNMNLMATLHKYYRGEAVPAESNQTRERNEALIKFNTACDSGISDQSVNWPSKAVSDFRIIYRSLAPSEPLKTRDFASWKIINSIVSYQIQAKNNISSQKVYNVRLHRLRFICGSIQFGTGFMQMMGGTGASFMFDPQADRFVLLNRDVTYDDNVLPPEFDGANVSTSSTSPSSGASVSNGAVVISEIKKPYLHWFSDGRGNVSMSTVSLSNGVSIELEQGDSGWRIAVGSGAIFGRLADRRWRSLDEAAKEILKAYGND